MQRKYNTHTVIKNSDINQFLTQTEKDILTVITSKICDCREKDGRRYSPDYYICNRDEPYANKVLRVILNGESDKEVSE